MKVDLTLSEFNATFSDLIDKERFEVYPIEGLKDGWIVYKKEKDKESV